MLVSESASSLVKISCLRGVESGVTGWGAQPSPRASLHVYTHLTYAFSKVLADSSFTPHSHDCLLVFPVLGSERDSLRLSGQSV